MTVHNHGPAEGPGLDCPERRTPIGNYLRGACLPGPAEPEAYCDHGPFDACRCLAPDQQLEIGPRIADGSFVWHRCPGPFPNCGCLAPDPAPAADAEDMHIYAHEFDPIGGFVCSACGTPTESEPCREHQPAAYSKIT